MGEFTKFLKFQVAGERGDPRPRNLTTAAKEVLEDVVVGFVVLARGTRLFLKRANEEVEYPVGGYDSQADKWTWRFSRLAQLVPGIKAEDIEVYA